MYGIQIKYKRFYIVKIRIKILAGLRHVAVINHLFSCQFWAWVNVWLESSLVRRVNVIAV